MDASGHAVHEAGHGQVGHQVPLWMLAGVLIVLLVLTFLTVAATWVNLGGLNLWIAMIIATIKAMLVALIFMHLAWERPFNAVVLGITLFMVVLFIGLTLHDVSRYQENVATFRQDHPDQIAPELQHRPGQ